MRHATDSINNPLFSHSAQVIGPPLPTKSGFDYERPRVALTPDGDVDVVFVGHECGPNDAAGTFAYKALPAEH